MSDDLDAGADLVVDGSDSQRPIVYCLIPAELAVELHGPLRRHFRDEPQIDVVVERRGEERRSAIERRQRQGSDQAPAIERRRIRGSGGRRVADRRATVVEVDAPPLPRRARRHTASIVFVERLEPSSQDLEDRDTARLVARFQAGERDTFSDLYTRYFDRVYAYTRLVLKDAHEAEDTTQEVFISVLQSLPAYERRSQPFRAWLFTLVRNRAVDRLRKHGRLELEDSLAIDRRRDARDPGEPNAVDWITDRDLMLFVERLPLAQRQVLVLRFILELSHSEVASVLGRSVVDVRAQQSRALRYLRDRLSVVRAPKHQRPARMRVYRRQAYVLRMRRFSLH